MVRRGPLEPALLLKQPFRTLSSTVLCKEGSALQLADGLRAGQATSCFPPRLPEKRLIQLSCCAASCPVAATAAAAGAGAAVVTRDDGCSNCGVD